MQGLGRPCSCAVVEHNKYPNNEPRGANGGLRGHEQRKGQNSKEEGVYGHCRLNTRPAPESDRTGAGVGGIEQSGNEAVETVYPMSTGTGSLWYGFDVAAY